MSNPLAIDAGAIVKKAVGFLEEAPGIKSSTRLIAILCLALAATITGVVDWYVIYQTIHAKPMDSSVLLALGGAIAAFVAQGAVAITKRNPTGCDNDRS